MRFSVPRIEDDDPDMAGKLRAIFRDLENALSKIRLDGSAIIGGGTPIEKHLSASATWNPASVNDNAQTSTTIAVTGALLGDEVTCSFSLDLQLMVLSGYVSASDVVTIVLSNNTGAPINLASGTLRVSTWRH